MAIAQTGAANKIFDVATLISNVLVSCRGFQVLGRIRNSRMLLFHVLAERKSSVQNDDEVLGDRCITDQNSSCLYPFPARYQDCLGLVGSQRKDDVRQPDFHRFYDFVCSYQFTLAPGDDNKGGQPDCRSSRRTPSFMMFQKRDP